MNIFQQTSAVSRNDAVMDSVIFRNMSRVYTREKLERGETP